MKSFKLLSKKTFSTILTIVMLVSAFPIASAALKTEDGFTYVKNNNEISITRYDGDAVELTVPETISGYPVTEICGGALMHKSSIKKLTLPKTLKRIGMAAVSFCENLKEINLEELENLETIGAMALCGSILLEGELTVPESVAEIGAGAFNATGYSKIHLGKNVKPAKAQQEKIQNSFVDGFSYGFPVYFVTKEAEKNIAQSCPNLIAITVSSQNQYLRDFGGVLYNKGMTEMYCYPTGKTSKIFAVPGTVVNIYNSFSAIAQLTIKILDVEATGEEYFDYTYSSTVGSLETVVLANSVKCLEKTAFYNSSIKSIFIPKSITSIGSKAFWHCINLKTVGFDRSSEYKSLPESCFRDCPNLESVKFGKIEYLSELVFSNCTSIKSIDLTEVLGLSPTAFDGCTNLETITYKDSDEAEKATVSNGAFDSTESLQTVMLGSSVGKIEANAFSNCASLNTAYISQEITDIDDTAFANCENLTIICDSEDSYAYKYAAKNNIPVTTMILSPIANQTYTGEEITPEITVKSSGKELKNGVDYDLFFEDNIDSGTASVIIFGKGDYSIFACVGKFAIMQRDLSDSIEISAVKDIAATGDALEPTVTLACGKYILQKDIDYTVNYYNNVSIGTGEIVVNGIGNFKGSITKVFNISESTEENSDDITAGDCDGDGNITIIDYAIAKSAIFNMEVLGKSQIKAADVNGDGVVDMFDVAEIDLIINRVG